MSESESVGGSKYGPDSEPKVSETVIIPHPNQIKTLADFQHELARLLPGSFFPSFPLYVRDFGLVPAGSDTVPAGSDTVPAGADIVSTGEAFSCTIEVPVFQDNKVVSPVRLEGEEIQKEGAITLAALLERNGASDKTIERAVLEAASGFFPLRLRVFRLAEAVFTSDKGVESWEVFDERWVKGTR